MGAQKQPALEPCLKRVQLSVHRPLAGYGYHLRPDQQCGLLTDAGFHTVLNIAPGNPDISGFCVNSEIVAIGGADGTVKNITRADKRANTPGNRPIVNLLRTSYLFDASGVQNCNPVADRHCLCLVVRYVQAREPECSLHLGQFFAQLFAHDSVDV